jgi:hypothetical protein
LIRISVIEHRATATEPYGTPSRALVKRRDGTLANTEAAAI